MVYKRPLPYLYVAREVFGSAGIRYDTSDALPLAAEPFAAAVDLVLDLVASSFTRTAIVSLLQSPHFRLGGDTPLAREAVSALDRALSEARYLGDLDRLSQLAGEWRSTGSQAPRCRRWPPRSPLPSGCRHCARRRRRPNRLSACCRFSTPSGAGSPRAARRRARAAVLATLEGLAAASRGTTTRRSTCMRWRRS